MKYILDTNILIYFLCNPAELSPEAKRIITTEKDLSLSIVSLTQLNTMCLVTSDNIIPQYNVNTVW